MSQVKIPRTWPRLRDHADALAGELRASSPRTTSARRARLKLIANAYVRAATACEKQSGPPFNSKELRWIAREWFMRARERFPWEGR